MWWRKNAPSQAASPEGTGRGMPGREERPCDERELERRVRDMLRALDVRPPLRVEELCQSLGEYRGRHIELRPYPLSVSHPYGVWVETSVADVILYQRETTALHQDHIIVHELGHILADHPSTAGPVEWAATVTGLKPSAVRRVLYRCTYDDAREREAELIAMIIMEWVSLSEAMPPYSQDPALRRIQAALGDSRGWL